MRIDTLKVETRAKTPEGQFNAVNDKVKTWVAKLEGETELTRDQCITFGLDKIERTDVSLVVEYIAIIDKKKMK